MVVINVMRGASLPPPADPTAEGCTSPQLRSMYGVVWSCLLTIFACTWTSLHPNILPCASPLQRRKYRGLLMLIALLMPEIIVFWAVRQWVASRSLTKEYREFGWTQTHSYFAIMGGFLYKQDRGNLDTKAVFASPYYDPLKTLIRRRRIILSEEEIQDKSKGDIFSKGLVLLQTSWFIIQFFARIGQQLPVTEIELVTLAYAFLNFATYFFWWNKPQNSGCPVRVYADELGDPPETEPETAVPTPTDNPDDPPSSDLELSRLNIENQVEDLLDTLPPPVSVTVEDELRFFSSEIGLSTSFVFIVTTLLVGNDIYKDIVMICTYAGRLPARETLRAFAFASGLATVFGAMHIAAWSFDFPSSFEQVAWRTYAVLLVILPVYSFLFFIQFHRNGLTRSAIAHFKPGSLAAIAYFNVPVFLGGVYIIARLALLVLMFVLLRKVPPGVYKSVSWTNYIPHF